MLRGAGIEISLPPGLAGAAASREVTLGVRPSSFHADLSRGAPIELRVVVAEYLGAQTILATRLADGTELLIETASGRSYRPGDTVTLAIDLAEILIFDRTSGNRL